MTGLSGLRRRMEARRTRDERGAIIPMVAMLLAVLIPSSALAVDLGMQRVVRRDMQALADVVALDLVRLIDGRTAAQIESGFNGITALDAAVVKSVARNDDVLGKAPVVEVKLAFMNSATHQLDQEVDVNGQMTTKEAVGSEVPTAIEVSAVGSIDFAFAPGEGGAIRRAVAVPAPSTCFRLGSFAAGVDTAQAELLNALLPGLLNTTSVGGTLVGYQGLASAELSLLDLVGVSGLGVGTPEELLALEGVTLGQFYAAMATVLQNKGGPMASLTLLQWLSTHTNLTTTIKLADLLDISNADTAALAAKFRILDLVTGAAYLANDENTLLIPGIATRVPVLGIGAVASLQVGEQPKLACGAVGRAKAKTGQVDLNLTGTLADMSLPLLVATATVQSATSTRLFLASAEGTLTKITCGDATLATNAEGIDVEVRSGLASVISVNVNLQIDATIDLVGVGRVTVDLLVPVNTSTSGSMAAGTVQFRSPPDSYGTAKRWGSNVVVPTLTSPGIPAGAQVKVKPPLTPQVTVATSSVPGLNAALTALISSAVSTVNNGLITQLNSNIAPYLASQLGVAVGGADVFALPRPSCQDPSLAG